MVKVFTTNSNNKIEFTKDELEQLLNEVWNDGYNSTHHYWWTSPTITTPNQPYYTVACDTKDDGISNGISNGTSLGLNNI